MPTPFSGREAADFWIQKKNYPKALLALRPLVKESPNDGELFYQIGFCLVKVGEYEEAHQQLERALECDPNHEQAQQLIDRIEYNPDAEGKKAIPDDEFNDAIAKKRVLTRITCPQCGVELLKNTANCSQCGYVFPHYKAIKAITSVVIVIAFFAGMRFYLHGWEGLYIALPTMEQFAGFIVGFMQTATALFVAALLTNYCEPDKEWNFEWKLDIGGACLAAICMAPVNAFTYMLVREISKVPGWSIFLLAPRIIEFVAALFFIWLFFQRKFIYLLLLVVTYYCISPLWYILFSPLRWLASFI